VEMAGRAGDQVGCDRVEDLTLLAPLVLPERGGVALQLVVGGADAEGRRPLSVYARPDGAEDEPWTQHATGVLATGARPAAFDSAVWPPEGAVPVPLDGFYDRLADAGFGYGPLFRSLVSAWRAGDEVFAEVGFPEQRRGEATPFGLHPALLDSALHAAAFAGLTEVEGGRLPFSWSGVSLHAVGA
ncbi:polyketide synthase dehydratase domain-containing protein, partial [Amycolatopsis sp. SID8362]|uniref:polyketide synthase dehydratase domain-containing protein n=1 Tax=Amycolatopsis sp. SID8362 TaxID=2690346 RepID=UPI00142C96F3